MSAVSFTTKAGGFLLVYLYIAGGHPTVDGIFRALSPNIPSFSKVTIYNFQVDFRTDFN